MPLSKPIETAENESEYQAGFGLNLMQETVKLILLPTIFKENGQDEFGETSGMKHVLPINSKFLLHGEDTTESKDGFTS